MAESGTLVWIEIPSKEPAKLKAFYATAFPSWTWRPEPTEEGGLCYHFELNRPQGLGGGIKESSSRGTSAAQPTDWGPFLYYLVEDIEVAEKRIHELGGITVVSKTDLGKHSCYMKMNDPEGNQFGIYSGITE